MRLATFVVHGQEHFGLVLTHPATREDWVFEPTLTQARLTTYAAVGTSGLYANRPVFFGQNYPNTLTDFLALEDAGMSAMRRLHDFLRRFLEQADQYMLQGAGFPLSSVKLRAPIPRPRLLLGLVQNSPTAWRNKPARLHVNLFPQGHQRPQGTVIDPGDPVVLPNANPVIGGWNPELGVIIGQRGRDIPVDKAMAYVAGLTVVSDVTVDYFRTIMFGQPAPYDWFEDAMSSWGDKKSDARFPMGPYLVTLDEIGNPYDLLVYTQQSGFLRDRSHTGSMNLGIEQTVSWLSSFRELQPGDVIHMATMGYDGSPLISDPPPTPNDYIESVIEKVGVLRNPLVFTGPSDWRSPDDPARRIHPSPNIRELFDRGQDRIHQWSPAETRHFWVTFGNYRSAESTEGLRPRPYPRFLNSPASALAASGHTVYLPPRAATLTFGCELACVIGRVASDVSVEDVPDYILGYCALAAVRDSSFADVVIEPATPQERDVPKVYARWADGFNVISPTPTAFKPDQVAGRACQLVIDGFGEVAGTTDEYVFSTSEVLAFISRYITLFPGDVITLGRAASLLTIEADQPIPAGTTGYAEIDGIGRVDFILDDHRKSVQAG
ncbi:MAG: fumarylacetoacetate hydrolase family protein [Anaerolineae bacterium]|nr:fumarylacetoacetate hydrolase family protein [Anaerolineae bacterium]